MSTADEANGTWDENRKSVLGRLARVEEVLQVHRSDISNMELTVGAQVKDMEKQIGQKLTSLDGLVNDLRVDIAGWKGRLAVWGALWAIAAGGAMGLVFKVLGSG